MHWDAAIDRHPAYSESPVKLVGGCHFLSISFFPPSLLRCFITVSNFQITTRVRNSNVKFSSVDSFENITSFETVYSSKKNPYLSFYIRLLTLVKEKKIEVCIDDANMWIFVQPDVHHIRVWFVNWRRLTALVCDFVLCAGACNNPPLSCFPASLFPMGSRCFSILFIFILILRVYVWACMDSRVCIRHVFMVTERWSCVLSSATIQTPNSFYFSFTLSCLFRL